METIDKSSRIKGTLATGEKYSHNPIQDMSIVFFVMR